MGNFVSNDAIRCSINDASSSRLSIDVGRLSVGSPKSAQRKQEQHKSPSHLRPPQQQEQLLGQFGDTRVEHDGDIFAGYISIQPQPLPSSAATTSRVRKLWAPTSSRPFLRKYAVLQGSTFNYYDTQTEYELRPDQTLNARPIDFLNFRITTRVRENCCQLLLYPDEDDTRGKEDDEEDDSICKYGNSSNKKKGGSSRSRRNYSTLKGWEFRCDTENEMINWRDAFIIAAACRLCVSVT
jgi:hypothetical protein